MPPRFAAVLLLAGLILAIFCAFVVVGALRTPSPAVRDLPIGVANLDRGASLGGRHVSFGSQVAASITHNPRLRGVVAWSRMRTRAGLIGAIHDDKDYAGLVVPADYSARLAALLNPRASPRAPATLQILTNPAAGITASSVSTGILLTAAGAVDGAVARRALAALSRAHVRLSPQAAPLYANPVRVVQTVAAPAPANTGRGGAPFYLALTVLLTAILGTGVLGQGVDAAARASAMRGTPPGEVKTWARKTTLALLFCVLAGAVQTSIAVGVIGVPASSWSTFMLLTILCLVTTALFTLFWSTLAGPRGIVLTILFAIALGVPASGGTVPVQFLPDVYVWLHSWVPLRFIVDGFRAVILFHGRADAGLQTAAIVLLIDSALFLGLAAAVAILKDRRRGAPQAPLPARTPELAVSR